MRFYEITISPSSQSPTAFTPITYTSLKPNGTNNGAALRVDLDIYQALFNQPAQAAVMTIYGVPFSDINQAANFNLADVSISLGMSKGLPITTPRNGLIINGTILQAYGNWQGTDVRLSLIIVAKGLDQATNANLSFNWAKGTSLQSAITNCLQTAYGQSININGTISANLIAPETQPGKFSNLRQLSNYVFDASKAINPSPSYRGVSLGYTSNGFLMLDGTDTSAEPKQIEYVDIIGNLTWKDIATIQAKLVMRNDLNIGDVIKFPLYAPTVNVALQSGGGRGKISFDGTFTVIQVRHVGSSRQANADSWVTIIDAQYHNAKAA